MSEIMFIYGCWERIKRKGDGVKKRYLAVLLVSGMLLVAVIPLKNMLYNPSTDVDSLRVRNKIEKPGPKYVPGELVIKFKKEATEEEINDLEIEQEAEEVYESPFTLARRWRVPPPKTVEEWEDFFDKHPLVEYAEPNYYVYATMIPNDPYYSYQWHLDNVDYGGIRMEAAWDIETGDPNIVVAVVDTGVAYEDYPALPHWHIDTYRAYSGHSWWCGLNNPDWTTPPGYGNGWKDYLQHAFDLTTATGIVTFSYQYRYHLERGYDYAYVEVSSDRGLTWDQLKSYTGPFSSRLVRWRADSVSLSNYKGSNILIRFRVYSDETYSDEDGYFNSDGAFFVDEIRLEDDSGTLFYDDVEGGPGAWETTTYEQAPDLAGTSFVAGYDFINNDAHANDDNSHGTHVTGTVAQTTNNNLGVAGVAFKTTIMPVKVLSAAGSGTYQQVADGIYYAVNNGADIINLSLGGSSPSAILEDAVAYAYNNGVTVIAASGNSNAGSCDYPAAYDAYVIAVGATQYDETKAPYSNYGPSLDVVAPGGNVEVDQNNDGYGDGVLQNTFGDTPVDWAYWFYQGTSMSTPHVSGVAALLLARNPTLTPDRIRNALESTAEDLGNPGRDDTNGWGLIDAQAALQSIAPAVHLLLTVEPSQATYFREQELTFTVNVFNQLNPGLESTLTLTVTGPSDYYYFDFQRISVAADAVSEYSFAWDVPGFGGTYVVEVGLVPPMLTAYDAVWLEVA